MKRRILLAAGAVVVLLAGTAALKVVTGIGPSLPGPELRSALGFDYELSACPEGFRNVRLPGDTATAARWDAAGRMPRPMDEPRAVTVGGRIYVVSGLAIDDGGSKFISLAYFATLDPATRIWRRLPDLPVSIDHPGLAVHDGAIYVVGGYVHGIPTDVFLKYVPEARRWERLPPLPTPRGALGAAFVGDRLYTVGGAGPYNNPDKRFSVAFSYQTVEIFDLNLRRWSVGPSLAVARNHLSVAAFDGMLFAVGGRSEVDGSSDVVERLEPGADSWTLAAPLPLGVTSLGLVVVGDRLVATGGGDDHERWVTPATWSLDPHGGPWRREADLREARHGHATAAVDGRVFVIGGAPCAGYGVTGSVESLDLSDAAP